MTINYVDHDQVNDVDHDQGNHGEGCPARFFHQGNYVDHDKVNDYDAQINYVGHRQVNYVDHDQGNDEVYDQSDHYCFNRLNLFNKPHNIYSMIPWTHDSWLYSS